MLETVREYALQRLEDAGETEAVRARHLAFHVAMAEEFEPHFFGPDEVAMYARCDLERQNLLSAYRHSIRVAQSAEASLRLVYGLRRWIARGAFDVGRPVLAVPLAQPGVQPRTLHRCRGLLAGAFLSYYRGAYNDALLYAREAVSIAREVDNVAFSADALTILGMACLGIDDRVAAQSNLVEAVSLARQAGANVVLLEALVYMAELHSIEGDFDKAEARYEETYSLGSAMQSPHNMMVASLNLARIAISRGIAQRAATLILQAIGIGGAAGLARNAQMFLGFGAGLATLVGDWETAARFYGASNSRFSETLQTREPADEAALAPSIAKARASADPSVFAGEEAAGGAMRTEDATAELRAWLSRVALELGKGG
jgi:hypothetical protein